MPDRAEHTSPCSLGNEAPSQGRWAVGQTNAPPRANAPQRLGFRRRGSARGRAGRRGGYHAQKKGKLERGAAAQGSSCFRFHCRFKSNSRFWRSAEVNGHCHDPMALSSTEKSKRMIRLQWAWVRGGVKSRWRQGGKLALMGFVLVKAPHLHAVFFYATVFPFFSLIW